MAPIKQLHEEDVVEESLSDSMTSKSNANYCLHSRKLKCDPGKKRLFKIRPADLGAQLELSLAAHVHCFFISQ